MNRLTILILIGILSVAVLMVCDTDEPEPDQSSRDASSAGEVREGVGPSPIAVSTAAPQAQPTAPPAAVAASPQPTATPRTTGGPVPSPTQAPGGTQSSSPTQVPGGTQSPSPIPTAVRPPAPTPAAVPDLRPDSFVVVLPRSLRPGYTESFSVTLLNADRPASGDVQLTLLDGGTEILAMRASVSGTDRLNLDVPEVRAGKYEVEVNVDGVPSPAKASVEVEESVLLFVETDKPIYKPGQTVHIRLMTMDAALLPLTSAATVEVQDAKGIKVFRKSVDTDEYGMANIDLPLSSEPNLGVWKIRATVEGRETQLDVRVEEYVLPKYEVIIDTEKEWVLADEPIKGVISGEYSFGKPVVGDVEIVAVKYVGQWEEFARYEASIDGEKTIELPPAGYVAGVPAAGGQGNVRLDVTVRERGTGYEEKSSKLLTVAASPVVLKVIPESSVFKPGLEMDYLVVSQTPDGSPVETDVRLEVSYMNTAFDELSTEIVEVKTRGGKAIVRTSPPPDAAALTLRATADSADTSLALDSGFSPSGNFIHVEQVTEGTASVGDPVGFRVNSTSQARNFYYEVVSRDLVVFSDVSSSPDIQFATTHLMAPSSKLLVYQVLQNNEIAADHIPFTVEASFPHQVEVEFSQDTVRPGEAVDIEISADGESRVGLVAVDKSVFILAENRLNLQQVFDELERLYAQPQVELHEARGFPEIIRTRGALETFRDAGVVVLTNKGVPSGEEYRDPRRLLLAVAAQARGIEVVNEAATMLESATSMAPDGQAEASAGLAEVQRVRQFFPETWIWQDVTTDRNGEAVVALEAPDSITTWMLRGVGMSKERGLGIGESELRVFQPFFLTVDLPFSAIRGEEFPVKIALFNYLETPQEIFVELAEDDWFDLLDEPVKSVTVGPSDIGGTEFMIRPKTLGSRPLKVTARSEEAADAVVRELLVDPEGIGREIVENHIVSTGDQIELATDVPSNSIEGSGRAYIALTGSLLTQTVDGLDQLLRMPFGCGEQNMILFAPNVYVTHYLNETNQLKPEIMAKAEHLMLVGYQRELTYRRSDGSFSAFGENDSSGSLWLTAFVLKTFAEARGLMYIDAQVLETAASWIKNHQLSDGSFENVGFLHHQELLGGLQGRTALTAYVAIALLEAGSMSAARDAIGYLETELSTIEDTYTLAITTYALGVAGSDLAGEARRLLLDSAQSDENGALYWGADADGTEIERDRGALIETTGYATLALLEQDDIVNAQLAAKWLAGQRNALGGFGSTQDTVVSLQALTALSAQVRSDVDATVTIAAEYFERQAEVNGDNADVLQLFEVPLTGRITVTVEGRGDVVLQSVVRYNIPERETGIPPVFDISVDYGTDHVAVDDLITVATTVTFNPPTPVEAGMVVLDVAVPTGFAPVRESVEAIVAGNLNVKRFEVAGRKVILYIEDMAPGESVAFEFQARAQYPVRAKEVVSQVYSYYRPEHMGETLAGAITVSEN